MLLNLQSPPPWVMNFPHIALFYSVPYQSSMAGIDVDVSDTHWSLASANYEARSAFPVPVLSAEAAAKFSKKKNQLVISVARRPA